MFMYNMCTLYMDMDMDMDMHISTCTCTCTGTKANTDNALRTECNSARESRS